MPGAEEVPGTHHARRFRTLARRAREAAAVGVTEAEGERFHAGAGARGGPPPEWTSRLVIASNRLPVKLQPAGDGGWDLRPATGGLVTALGSVMERLGGVWVGWPGTSGVGERELSEGLTRLWGTVPYELQRWTWARKRWMASTTGSPTGPSGPCSTDSRTGANPARRTGSTTAG